jgi:hypothetical protein
MKTANSDMEQSKAPLRRLGAAAVITAALAGIATTPANAHDLQHSFEMVRAAGVVKADCLLNATAKVRIKSDGPIEVMDVTVAGLPPKTDFDFFVIQVPNTPFGLSWYQGDIETDEYGEGHERFVGRFNEETFIVAPGVAPAPLVHNNAFPDASPNPQTGPIHTYHLGLWFNSPKDAVKAGCPGGVTPFNGEHNAGIQVLNTSQFKDAQGPLFNVKP